MTEYGRIEERVTAMAEGHAAMEAVLRLVKRWLDMPVPAEGEVLPTFLEVSKAVDEVLKQVEGGK